MGSNNPDALIYLINRSKEDDHYTVWRVDESSVNLLVQEPVSPSASFPHRNRVCQVGNYLLSYAPPEYLTSNNPGTEQGNPADTVVKFELREIDGTQHDPLNGIKVCSGTWPLTKFYQFFNHYTSPVDPLADIVQLIPVTGYVLAFMGTAARGTYQLWNFDAASPASPPDPLPDAVNVADAFALIGEGSQLLPIANYVLEWLPATSTYRLWSFDPQLETPLSLPYVYQGSLTGVTSQHQLVVLGEQLLVVGPDGAYQVYAFDPLKPRMENAEPPLSATGKSGFLPSGFNAGGTLLACEPTQPINPAKATTPQTMDYMREQIKHVVVYMLESRTFDNVLGWLYENGQENINWLNATPPFRGASASYSNSWDGTTYPLTQFQQGRLSRDFDLTSPTIDPFHGTADSIHQLYSNGYSGYQSGDTPDMGGFVTNNLSPSVMATLSPAQLPVLNGLAKQFAVSDEWFSALPGLTSSNRAFALSGSSFNMLTNLEGPPQYTDFPTVPHRQSIFKVLANNGITDWRIYYSVMWMDYVFTYQLYLKGQVPSVDADPGRYVSYIDNFCADAKAGALPAFSFLEPAWIAPTGSTSYHPGGDLVPPERQLNKIWEAVSTGKSWKNTALIITFSKGGGLYDHVPPPCSVPGWPFDENDGFKYDRLGPRVPSIVVSPLVKPGTVFRSPVAEPFTATSIPATLLSWFGIPRSRWGLGDRVERSATFESVFQEAQARVDLPRFDNPYDKQYPGPN